MEKTTTIWLIIAACLVVLGVTLFTVVMWLFHWDFTKLGTVKYETNTYPITEDFRSISINTDTADIRFLPSEDGSCTVVCHEGGNEKHTVSVQENTLTIQVNNHKNGMNISASTSELPGSPSLFRRRPTLPCASQKAQATLKYRRISSLKP